MACVSRWVIYSNPAGSLPSAIWPSLSLRRTNSLPHLTYQVGQEELWAADISINHSLYWNPRKSERSFSLPELKETRFAYYRTCGRWHSGWGAVSSILLTPRLLCPQAEVPLSLQEGSQPLGINGTLFSKEVQDPLLAKAQEGIILQDDWQFLKAKNPLNTIHLEKIYNCKNTIHWGLGGRLKIGRPFFFLDACTLYLQTHGKLASLARKMLGTRICLETWKVSLTFWPYNWKGNTKSNSGCFPYENQLCPNFILHHSNPIAT